MAFKEPKRNWFQKDLKNSRKDFKNVENCIEVFKFKFEKGNRLTEWVIGIALALFLSVSINNLLNNPIKLVIRIGIWAYIITLILVLITILLQIWTIWRQKKVISWLYREKDKEEN